MIIIVYDPSLTEKDEAYLINKIGPKNHAIITRTIQRFIINAQEQKSRFAVIIEEIGHPGIIISTPYNELYDLLPPQTLVIFHVPDYIPVPQPFPNSEKPILHIAPNSGKHFHNENEINDMIAWLKQQDSTFQTS